MKFCNQCGHPVVMRMPEGDNRERHICDNCHTIHYQNPRIIAGVLPVYGEQVLLCRRAIQPRHGYWTLPAGFMENGETVEEAAAREAFEEALAEVSHRQLYTVISLPHIHQVYMLFLSDLYEGRFGVGEESLECRLFHEDEIPWNELAFPTISKTLHYFFEDRKLGDFQLRCTEIRYPPRAVSR